MVKRFDFIQASMDEYFNGDYVESSDYDDLLKENTALEVKVTEFITLVDKLEAKITELEWILEGLNK